MDERRPRAVVVDNSATVRGMLTAGLQERGIDVVANGADGGDAVALCELLQPDVLSLDLMMPGVGGAEALRELAARRIRVPVVIVSGVTAGAADLAMRLLDEGAVEVLAKPVPGEPVERFLDEYARQLRIAAAANVDLLWNDRDGQAAAGNAAVRRPGSAPEQQRLVVLVASTGGPRALHRLLQGLPSSGAGSGMLIVQHMPPGFTSRLARRLDADSELRVREASDGDDVRPGCALMAPGGRHLRLRSPRTVSITDEPAVRGLRPRGDLTILDAVEHHGDRVVLVVLTGMGTDGLEGARAVRERGGLVIAESGETALISGMPAAVAAAGLADEVLPLPEIAAAICRSIA